MNIFTVLLKRSQCVLLLKNGQFKAMHTTMQLRNDAFANLCKSAGIEPKIGFIGGGNMAQAMYKGLIRSELIPAKSIFVSDINDAAIKTAEENGVTGIKNNKDMLEKINNGIAVLAIKPQFLNPLLDDVRTDLPMKAPLILSIIAGRTIKSITDKFNPAMLHKKPVILRIMPNSPAMVGAGASVFAKSKLCKREHVEITQMLLETMGLAFELPEHQIDACNGLSGSGPGYVYSIIEALSDGGVKVGLPRELSTTLAAATVMGAAQMVLKTDLHPAQLRDMVSSPGGTTIYGLHAMEAGNVRNSIMNAVEAACNRATELGQAAAVTAQTQNQGSSSSRGPPEAPTIPHIRYVKSSDDITIHAKAEGSK